MSNVKFSTEQIGSRWIAVAYIDGPVLIANSIPSSSWEAARAAALEALQSRGISDYQEGSSSTGRDLAKRVADMDPSLPVSYEGMSRFRIKVLEFVRHIPKGKVASYGDVAIAVGHPRAYRAVGTAMATHPYPYLIPCHRVVRSNLSPGRYGQDPIAKIKFLEEEGVAMANGRIMERYRLAPSR